MSQQQVLLACRCLEQSAGWRDLVRSTPDVRLHDSSPGANGDVSRRDDICEASEPTGCAFETLLVDAVGRIYTSALRTGDACISGINVCDMDSAESSLVVNEAPQLGKRPVVLARPLGPSNRYPIANMSETLQSNSAIGVSSPTHQLLTYDVICVSLELRLAAGDLSQFALGCASPSPLKISTSMLKSSSIEIYRSTVVTMPIRVR